MKFIGGGNGQVVDSTEDEHGANHMAIECAIRRMATSEIEHMVPAGASKVAAATRKETANTEQRMQVQISYSRVVAQEVVVAGREAAAAQK